MTRDLLRPAGVPGLERGHGDFREVPILDASGGQCSRHLVVKRKEGFVECLADSHGRRHRASQ